MGIENNKKTMNLKKNFNFHIFILHGHFALLTLMLMIEAIQEFLGDTGLFLRSRGFHSCIKLYDWCS